MANENSQIITDVNATPVVKTNQLEAGGVVRETCAVLSVTSGAASDIKRMVRIPSRARVVKVEMANTDLDSNGVPTLAADVGLYDINGGAVVDADFFASAITQLQAAAGFTDITYESGVVTVANRLKPLWQQLGLTSDPNKEYEIALTYTAGAATHANGDIAMRVQYVVQE